MNRRNFLSFIPALSTIPFISANIEKTASGIFIEKPTPAIIKDLSPTPINNLLELEVRLYANGNHVGNAFITNLTINNPLIETTCSDRTWIPSNREMTMEFTVLNVNELLTNTI